MKIFIVEKKFDKMALLRPNGMMYMVRMLKATNIIFFQEGTG